MKWEDLRPGDAFLCRDAKDLESPDEWLGKVYTVVAVEVHRTGWTGVQVLSPGGTLSPTWSGSSNEDYYADVLVGRGP